MPDDCTHFEANFAVRVQNPVKNQSSAVQFQYSQPDRRMPVMKADYYLPAGWRFGGLSNLRPSAHPDCPSAHTSNGSLDRTELLSADTGMLVRSDSQRNDNPTDQQELQRALNGPPSSTPGATRYGVVPGNRPSVSFLSWDGTTARVCYHHRSGGDNARTFIQSATLTRLAGNAEFDWRLSVDVSSVMRDPTMISGRATIIEHHVGLGALPAGNWSTHPVTGEFQKVPFSRTPLEPGLHPFRADLFTCAEGLTATEASGCVNGTYVSQTLRQTVNITSAPDTIKFDHAKLAGPATEGLCASAYCPLGLIRGTNAFEVSWTQPPLIDGQAVRGYAHTIALPGNQHSRRFFRLVTDSATPGFNATVCGPAGDDPICRFAMRAPDAEQRRLDHADAGPEVPPGARHDL